MLYVLMFLRYCSIGQKFSLMVSSVPSVTGLAGSWMDRENGPGVVLLSQRHLTKHNPGPEMLVHGTLILCG